MSWDWERSEDARIRIELSESGALRKFREGYRDFFSGKVDSPPSTDDCLTHLLESRETCDIDEEVIRRELEELEGKVYDDTWADMEAKPASKDWRDIKRHEAEEELLSFDRADEAVLSALRWLDRDPRGVVSWLIDAHIETALESADRRDWGEAVDAADSRIQDMSSIKNGLPDHKMYRDALSRHVRRRAAEIIGEVDAGTRRLRRGGTP